MPLREFLREGLLDERFHLRLSWLPASTDRKKPHQNRQSRTRDSSGVARGIGQTHLVSRPKDTAKKVGGLQRLKPLSAQVVKWEMKLPPPKEIGNVFRGRHTSSLQPPRQLCCQRLEESRPALEQAAYTGRP